MQRHQEAHQPTVDKLLDDYITNLNETHNHDDEALAKLLDAYLDAAYDDMRDEQVRTSYLF